MKSLNSFNLPENIVKKEYGTVGEIYIINFGVIGNFNVCVTLTVWMFWVVLVNKIY